MKVIAINGSPRKTKNTATLLKKAIEGSCSMGGIAETIHLYDLNYKGCISCFACKHKMAGHPGKCAMTDDLLPILEKIEKADILLLGSPVYLGHVSGEMASFMERLIFPNLRYAPGYPSQFKGKLASGFIYTMNVSEDIMTTLNYKNMFLQYHRYQKMLKGTAEYIVSNDTHQFDDYSLYDVPIFDSVHKAKIQSTQFPIDCHNAYEMGARLAQSYLQNL